MTVMLQIVLFPSLRSNFSSRPYHFLSLRLPLPDSSTILNILCLFLHSVSLVNFDEEREKIQIVHYVQYDK